MVSFNSVIILILVSIEYITRSTIFVWIKISFCDSFFFQVDRKFPTNIKAIFVWTKIITSFCQTKPKANIFGPPHAVSSKHTLVYFIYSFHQVRITNHSLLIFNRELFASVYSVCLFIRLSISILNAEHLIQIISFSMFTNKFVCAVCANIWNSNVNKTRVFECYLNKFWNWYCYSNNKESSAWSVSSRHK